MSEDKRNLNEEKKDLTQKEMDQVSGGAIVRGAVVCGAGGFKNAQSTERWSSLEEANQFAEAHGFVPFASLTEANEAVQKFKTGGVQ